VVEINGDWDHNLKGDREEDDLGPLFASLFFCEEFADPGGWNWRMKNQFDGEEIEAGKEERKKLGGGGSGG